MDVEGDENSRTLFIGNLSPNVTDEILYELFLQAGPVEYVKIPYDKVQNVRKSFGFVCYKHACSVPYALHLLADVPLFKREIRLQQQRDTIKRDSVNPLTVGIHSLDPQVLDTLERKGRPSRCLPNSVEPGLISPSLSVYARLGDMQPHSSLRNNRFGGERNCWSNPSSPLDAMYAAPFPFGQPAMEVFLRMTTPNTLTPYHKGPMSVSNEEMLNLRSQYDSLHSQQSHGGSYGHRRFQSQDTPHRTGRQDSGYQSYHGGSSSGNRDGHRRNKSYDRYSHRY